MPFKTLLRKSPIYDYAQSIKAAPREVICNKSLLLTALLFALGAVPLTWDQGSAATMTSLPAFQKHFGIDSATDAHAIRNFVSLVGVGDFSGAGLSFFLNDRVGRLWSYRIYVGIWMVGQVIAIFAPNLPALYVARIVCGLGIGALLTSCPISLVEIAPPEIRGMLTAWFMVAMGMAHGVSSFCVYGIYINPSLENTRLQYQLVWIAPLIFMGLCVFASFFLQESPRWLSLVNRNEEAARTLVKLRGLPETHPRVRDELQDIRNDVRQETDVHGIAGIVKETFTKPSNLRRFLQCLVLYSLPQLSGANSVTSYFIPILKIVGSAGDTGHNLFLTSMYAMGKFLFACITAFFLIDALGRRRSLFLGIACQTISDIYVGVYVKMEKEGDVSKAASQAALAAVFVQAFGYSAGLLTLPYVFAGELWPNRIRSFGAALSQFLHRLFIYVMHFAMPSILSSMDDWGAFIFFGGWCAIAFLYVFLFVPEVSGLSVEEMDDLFSGPWLVRSRKKQLAGRNLNRDPGSAVYDNEGLSPQQSKISVELRE